MQADEIANSISALPIDVVRKCKCIRLEVLYFKIVDQRFS